MDISGVKVSEAEYVKINRVLEYFGLISKYTRGGTNVYVKSVTYKKYKLFGLVSFTRLIRSKKLFGELGKMVFAVHHRDNLPLAVMFVKKLSAELGRNIEILLSSEDGKPVDYNLDDPNFLNNRREFLEQEQRRIENDLADVHKKLQALEGDGGPYRRALSAVE